MSSPPNVSQVAALLRSRTRDRFGNELGTFTAETRPTDSEVQRLIDQAAELVVPGNIDVPANCASSVSHLIALRAALLVEISFFPEQVATGRSPYTALTATADSLQSRVDFCLGIATPTNGGGGSGTGEVFIGMPRGYAPEWPPLVGEVTRW